MLIATHPFVILNPFIPVDDAVVNRPPATESWRDGDVVPMPNQPFEFMVRAELVDVARPWTVVVAR